MPLMSEAEISLEIEVRHTKASPSTKILQNKDNIEEK